MIDQPAHIAPLAIVLNDTTLDRARRSLATCKRKLAQQTTPESRFYYEMCIKGWQRYIESLEAEQE